MFPAEGFSGQALAKALRITQKDTLINPKKYNIMIPDVQDTVASPPLLFAGSVLKNLQY
jgi:patatin-like phospholipase/acyl hydrolase